MQISRLAGKRLCLLGPDENATAAVAAALAGALRSLGHPVLVVDADPAGPGPYRALGLETPPRDLLTLVAETPHEPGRASDALDALPVLGSTVDLEALPRTHIDCGPDGTWLIVLGKHRTLGAAAAPAVARFLRHLEIESLGADGVVIVVHGDEAPAGHDAATPLDRRLLVVPPELSDAAWLAVAERMRTATETADGCVLYVDAGASLDAQAAGRVERRLALLDLRVLGRIGPRGRWTGRTDGDALAIVRALEATEPGRASEAPATPAVTLVSR